MRKVWRHLRREGFDVARCTEARLMKAMGVQGISRGKPHKMTILDKMLPITEQGEPSIPCACAYLLSVSDFTYVAT